MNGSTNILLVDNSATRSNSVVNHLLATHAKAEIKCIHNAESFEETLVSRRWDLILCEYSSPHFRSTQVLEILRRHHLKDVTCMVVSGLSHRSPIPISMHRGQIDFIFKADAEYLVGTLDRREDEPTVSNPLLYRGMPPIKPLRMNSLLDQLHDGLCAQQTAAADKSKADPEATEATADRQNPAQPFLPTPCGHQTCDLLSQVDFRQCDVDSVVDRVCNGFCQCPKKPKSPVDVNAAMLAARAATYPHWQQAAETGASPVELILRCNATQRAWGDEAQLSEVLTNLINNSCEALTGTGGSIEITSRDVESEVEIIVNDNGPGIDGDVRSRCVGPFFSTKHEEGAGLGLSIVDRIVLSFGGSMRIERPPDMGTSVILTLRGVESQFRSDKRSGEKLKALIVDDDPVAASFVERHLLRLGHYPVSLSNPLEAITMLQSIEFDVVLSDRTMPQMSGDDLALHLQKEHPQTLFAMVTGHGDQMLTDNEIPQGVHFVIPKPISKAGLKQALESLFPAASESIALAR